MSPSPFNASRALEDEVAVAPAELDAPELSGAAEIARFLVQSLKTHRIHGNDSAAAVASVERLHARLGTFFSEHALVSIAFTVVTDALLYKGHQMLDLTQSVDQAFSSMVRSGIRQFGFLDAILIESLSELVRLMVECPADSADFDLATLLWERDFDQVQYLVVESFAEDLASPHFQHELEVLLSSVGAEVPVDTVRAARISEDDLRVKVGEAQGISEKPEDVFHAVAEEEGITSILANSTEEHLPVRLVNMVLRLVQETPDAAERPKLETRLVSLLQEEMGKSKLESMERAVKLLQEAAVRAKDSPAGASAKVVLNQLARSATLLKLIDKVELTAIHVKELAGLFRILGVATIPIAYAVARRVPTAATVAPLIQTLSELSREDPQFLIRQLTGKTAEAERICIPALAPLTDRAVGSALLEVFKHGGLKTKVAIVRGVGHRREPLVRSLLIHALTGEEPELRIWGYRLLSQFQDRGLDRPAADALFDGATSTLLKGTVSQSELGEVIQAMLSTDFRRSIRQLAALVEQRPALPGDSQWAVARTLREYRSPAGAPVIKSLLSHAQLPQVLRECEAALKELPHVA